MKVRDLEVPYLGSGLLGGGAGGTFPVLVDPFLGGSLGLIWMYGRSLVVSAGLRVV